MKGPWMRVMECELCKSVMSNFRLKISYYQQGGIKRTLRLVRKGEKYSLGGKEGPKTCQFENDKKILNMKPSKYRDNQEENEKSHREQKIKCLQP